MAIHISAQEDEPNIRIERGANWDTEINLDTNIAKKTYYVGVVNIQNESGDFIPFEEYVKVSINNGLVFERENSWGVTFKPLFVMQDNSIYNWADIPASIEKTPWKTSYRGKIKYGFDFGFVPDAVKTNLKYVVLERVDSYGLTWEDVSVSNNAINVFDNGINKTIVFSHDDILKTYTIPLINKSHVVIGNLSENFILNSDGTWNISFDPTVSYNFSDETNIWAYEGSNCADIAEPDGYYSSGCDFNSDLTSDSALDISDDIRELTSCIAGGVGDSSAWIVFNASIQQTRSTINYINWTWEGHRDGLSEQGNFYLWDYTNSLWIKVCNDCMVSVDAVHDISTTNITGFIEADGTTNILIWMTTPDTSSRDIHTDFVKLEVTYTVDTTPPSINFTSPTDINTTITTRNWTFVNTSASETLDNCTLNWNNYATNYTMNELTTTSFYYNVTNIANGNYTYRVSCNDTSGNLGNSSTIWANINVPSDTCTPPASANWIINDSCIKTADIDHSSYNCVIADNGYLNIQNNAVVTCKQWNITLDTTNHRRLNITSGAKINATS